MKREAKEVGEDTIIEALKLAHEHNQILLKLQEDLINKAQVKPQEYELFLPSEEIKEFVSSYAQKKIKDILDLSYAERLAGLDKLKEEFVIHIEESLSEEEIPKKQLYLDALEMQINEAIRLKIITTSKRLDGRDFNQVRPLSSQVSLLPRTHGSALFTRGVTQALNIVTLASTSFAQVLDTMDKDEERYYFHHYNAPGYTLGEVKRMGSPGRREIGHSYLAQRALEPVLPSLEDFPYTIRSVTEIMSQQGSTSMAATCASCLALMDAGVPLKSPISGVAMGLILDDKKPLFLTDIADAEDFAGDMDFKVAGSKKGITALQMDMKVAGLEINILSQALNAAIKGRQVILEHMLSVLASPRKELSSHAPQVKHLRISVNKIKDLIGKGGETIHELTAKTGAQIDIKEDGSVFVFCADKEALDRAIKEIHNLTDEPELGKIYYQKSVVKVTDFGAFVQFIGSQDGLVHVSEISVNHVKSVSDVLKVGDKVDVKLVAIDDHGRFNLSMKQVQ